MSRRDSNDVQWKEIKKAVCERDNSTDRLLRALTVKEALILQHAAPLHFLRTLDPAHIYPVSTHPHLTYCIENIVTLNRYSHENLDSMRDPITGHPLSREEVMNWWKKIAGKFQWEKLQKQLNPPND